MSPTPLPARILIIAGSDSGGGAGIQGDIKTISALGGYAMTAITAITAQNTQGVFGVHPVPESFIAQQIKLCLSDIGADAIKTGMLHSAAVIETVVDSLPPEGIPLIVDPVMIAKGGAPLLHTDALYSLKKYLIPMAKIITPNLPEAEFLLGHAIEPSPSKMIDAVNELIDLGSEFVLLKGGHADSTVLTDVLGARNAAPVILTAPRRDTRHTHGTGCSFASAIATSIGQGLTMEEAVRRAHAYVQAAMEAAPGFGQGHGPLWHGATRKGSA